MKLSSITYRNLLIMLHDLAATFVALVVAIYVRYQDIGFVHREGWLYYLIPGFLAYAAVIYVVFDLYRGKWRFASVVDLQRIAAASTILAVSLLILDYVLVSDRFYGTFFFGKVTIAFYWLLQLFCLGAGRVIYRSFRYTRTRKANEGTAAMSLVVGEAAEADILLRAIEAGAVQKIWPVGILSPSAADQSQTVRGTAVYGRPADLEAVMKEFGEQGSQINRVVFLPNALAKVENPGVLIMQARRLGLTVGQVSSFEGNEPPRITPVAIEDLLLRPSVDVDYPRLEEFIKGKNIIVTGGGGSIGSELCDRVVAFGAGRLLVIDNSEPALHAVLEKLAVGGPSTEIEGRIADVRDRDRMFRLFEEFSPDIVFHAAALKHVPILERDWGEGVKTNIYGSINVADAAVAVHAAAMVMISTDKAVKPVSVLGATKRFAEMYCQALDADLMRAAGDAQRTRIVSVRFGNVLASNGSVVPKFKAQIQAGGPITVTHPDMVRYFMTVREACDLVLTAARHAVGDGGVKVGIYVLNMGQPVKIVDLAERMVRLSGLQPGVDIDIKFIGIRPGERLNEILFDGEEPKVEIGVEGVVAARASCPTLWAVRSSLKALNEAMESGDRSRTFKVIGESVPDFHLEQA